MAQMECMVCICQECRYQIFILNPNNPKYTNGRYINQIFYIWEYYQTKHEQGHNGFAGFPPLGVSELLGFPFRKFPRDSLDVSSGLYIRLYIRKWDAQDFRKIFRFWEFPQSSIRSNFLFRGIKKYYRFLQCWSQLKILKEETS